MRKIISVLIAAVLLGMAMPAEAQIKFGVKGGVNLAKADLDKSTLTTNNFTGFFLGPMIDLRIPIVGLGVDGALLFSQKGAKLKGETNTNPGIINETIRQNGLEIPVNLKYSIGLGDMAGIYFAAGPSFFFNFSDDKKIGDTEFQMKSSQLAINLGFGIKLLNHLQIGANYNMPLTDSAEVTFGSLTNGDSYKTKTWQISVAYLF